MLTPEEIKSALKKYRDDKSVCDMCKFSVHNVDKWRALMGLALNYIEQLESQSKPQNRILTLEESLSSEDPVWFEQVVPYEEVSVCEIITGDISKSDKARIYLIGNTLPKIMNLSHYKKTWRCWSNKPTEEERKQAKWESSTPPKKTVKVTMTDGSRTINKEFVVDMNATQDEIAHAAHAVLFDEQEKRKNN